MNKRWRFGGLFSVKWNSGRDRNVFKNVSFLHSAFSFPSIIDLSVNLSCLSHYQSLIWPVLDKESLSFAMCWLSGDVFCWFLLFSFVCAIPMTIMMTRWRWWRYEMNCLLSRDPLFFRFPEADNLIESQIQMLGEKKKVNWGGRMGEKRLKRSSNVIWKDKTVLTLVEIVLRLLSKCQYASGQLGSASAREEERLARYKDIYGRVICTENIKRWDIRK